MSELYEDINAVVTGIKSNSSVSLVSSPGSITCSQCGSTRKVSNGVEVHCSEVHDDPDVF